MKNTIKKAVFPVAGLGTRFLPATKACPKEMLPIVDKPLIQYAVEEAAAAGIETMIFVTSKSKRIIEDHFDRNSEMEQELEAKGKEDLLESLREIVPANISCVFIRQAEALGLGHAVHCAKPVVGNEPFAVILPDDLIADGTRGCMSQMVSEFEQMGNSILAVERVNPADTESYGIVKLLYDALSSGPINEIVEKPKPELAPSNLAVVGRYILTPAIFEKIENIGRGAGGEIQLTDAIADLLKDEQVKAYEFEGKRYDCGSKLGYLKANFEYALCNDELKDEFSDYLGELVLSNENIINSELLSKPSDIKEKVTVISVH
jgi:UTP--glucose-1-phosphate uridylyltransferase